MFIQQLNTISNSYVVWNGLFKFHAKLDPYQQAVLKETEGDVVHSLGDGGEERGALWSAESGGATSPSDTCSSYETTTHATQ
jgi:hypothetical protein